MECENRIEGTSPRLSPASTDQQCQPSPHSSFSSIDLRFYILSIKKVGLSTGVYTECGNVCPTSCAHKCRIWSVKHLNVQVYLWSL